MAANAEDELGDEVEDLLNDAMLADTEKEKLDAIAQIREILLNRAPQALLDEYLPHATALHTDKSAVVRRAIIGLMEDAGVKHDYRAWPRHFAALCRPAAP